MKKVKTNVKMPSRTSKRKVKKEVISTRRAVSAVSRGVNLTTAGMMFLACSLDPLNSKGSVGIPDAFSGKSVVVDHKQSFTVSASASGEIAGILMPTLPGSFFLAKGSMVVPIWGKGSAVAAASNLVCADDYNNTLLGQLYSEYNGTAVNIGGSALDLGALSNPYFATKARVTSMGIRVTPLNSLLTTQGEFTVAKISGEAYPSGTGRIKFGQTTSAGAWANSEQSAGSYPTRVLPATVEYNTTSISGYPGYRVFKAIDGFTSVANRDSDSFDFSCWTGQHSVQNGATSAFVNGSLAGNLQYIVGNTNGTLNVNPANFATLGQSCNMRYGFATNAANDGYDTDLAPPCFYDDKVERIIFAGSGFATGATPTSFQFDVVTCVEYQVDPTTSPISKFVKTAPRADPTALAILSEAQRKMPVALPSSSVNGGWAATARNILQGISKVAVIGARAGLPYIGQAANVADIFGGVLDGM
jgi:hypothetical protein